MAAHEAARTWERWMRFLADYHRWEVVGAEHCPKEGGVVFAATHSLASYELFIVASSSTELMGRRTYIVGDDLVFKLPGLGGALRDIGFISGGRDEIVRRLREGDMIGIAPGGMREALRGRRQRYRFDWSSRMGFAAVAMRAGVPVVPAVCPLADHIFDVYDNPVTDWVYRRLRIPVPIFRGRGLTPLPKPVKLVQLVGKPIYPDVAPDRITDADVARFHGRIVGAVAALMEQGKAMGESPRGPDVRTFGTRSAAGAQNEEEKVEEESWRTKSTSGKRASLRATGTRSL